MRGPEAVRFRLKYHKVVFLKKCSNYRLFLFPIQQGRLKVRGVD